MTDNNEEFLTETELGTKQYWDHFYGEELANFNDFGDTGEVWFGTRNVRKIVEWIEKNIEKNSFICDIGCGNGFILAQLADKSFLNLYGLDYSEKAIEFCNVQYSTLQPHIHFKVVDILEDQFLFESKYDVIIDKGTYDAICLMLGADIKSTRSKYLKFLKDNLKNNGYFIIVTCNFTRDEMLNFLLNKNNDEANFRLIHEFDTPTLSFGGRIGKQVTGLIFHKFY